MCRECPVKEARTGGLETWIVLGSEGHASSRLFILQMACEAGCRPLGVFECQLCALTAPYSYVGQKPPNTQSIVLWMLRV